METTQKVLEKLTKAQEALLAKVADEYIADITAGGSRRDKRAIDRWLAIVYAMFDGPVPARVEIVGSLEAALNLANELDPKGKHTYADDTGFSDGGWLSFYDYFERIGVLDAKLSLEEADALKAMRALVAFRRVAWDTVLFDEAAIVIARPKAIRVDDEGRLHGEGRPCIEWPDGKAEYAWHGTWVSEKIATAPRSHTREEFLAISNTEERRALCEAAGWSWVAEILNAAVIDKWTDPATQLSYELLSCSDRSKLLRKQSPPLKQGEQPIYMEPVHEELKTARAARKWQATDWTPARCEADPSLTYGVEA